jgi:hypothetical protein
LSGKARSIAEFGLIKAADLYTEFLNDEGSDECFIRIRPTQLMLDMRSSHVTAQVASRLFLPSLVQSLPHNAVSLLVNE